MQAGPGGLKGNMIDGSKLEGLIEEYLQGQLHFDQSRAAARAVVEHLRQRNFILCFVGADSYGFVHRTFLEYFCAAEIVHQFNVAKTLTEEALIALYDQHCQHDEWREVLRLIGGQIDEQFVGRIIEHLAARTNLRTWYGYSYLPELALAALLVQEARNPQRLEAVGGTLLDLVIKVVGWAGEPLAPPVERLMDELVGAIESVGTRWPGAGRFLPLALPEFQGKGTGKFVWARLVAALEGDVAGEKTRVLATESTYSRVRAGALEVLAAKWPGEATRTFLAERAVQDRRAGPRSAALGLLAEKWPDEMTRNLLSERAVRDRNEDNRRFALRWLAEKWPDETTRTLLTDRAVQDQDAGPRGAALELLAEKWPDEKTRTLLTDRAVHDQEGESRRAALKLLTRPRLRPTSLATIDDDHSG